MRASFALLPALAAMTMASRCRPRTTTSSLATSILTSAVVSRPTSSADPTSSAVSIIESTTTTASDEPTTTEASSVEPSSVEPATSEPPTTSKPPTTSELPTTSEPPTTTEAPTTTEEPTTSEPPTTSELPTTSEPPTTTEAPTTTSAESATSTAPSAAPTVTGLCLKAITPNVANNKYHIRAVSPSSNLQTEAPNLPNLALFDLDISTGKMTISNGAWAGYEVYTPPPFDNQATRVIRFTNLPVEYPLRCSNPDGVYSTGSVLKCEVTAPWGDGVMRRYATFSSSINSPAGAWSIVRDDYVRAGAYNYDLGMFFGDDCSEW